MTGKGKDAVPRVLRATLVVAAATSLLAGCGLGSGDGGSPNDGSSPTMTVEEAVAAIKAATPNTVTPEEVAETFALGTNATDIQRESMKKDLVGSVVEWDLIVYEVRYTDGKYQVQSQPIPIRSADTVDLVHVLAYVIAQSPEDHALLRSVKTGDRIRIRGLVQDVMLRTVVTIGPGVVISRSERSK